MFRALAAAVWRFAEGPGTLSVPAGRSPELRLALTLTDDRLGEELRFDDIARDVGLTPRSLARRFEDECGMTWSAALRRMRVLRAIEMLATAGSTVTTIAHAVGYTSLSAFNLAFQPHRPNPDAIPPDLPSLTHTYPVSRPRRFRGRKTHLIAGSGRSRRPPPTPLDRC